MYHYRLTAAEVKSYPLDLINAMAEVLRDQEKAARES